MVNSKTETARSNDKRRVRFLKSASLFLAELAELPFEKTKDAVKSIAENLRLEPEYSAFLFDFLIGAGLIDNFDFDYNFEMHYRFSANEKLRRIESELEHFRNISEYYVEKLAHRDEEYDRLKLLVIELSSKINELDRTSNEAKEKASLSFKNMENVLHPIHMHTEKLKIINKIISKMQFSIHYGVSLPDISMNQFLIVEAYFSSSNELKNRSSIDEMAKFLGALGFEKLSSDAPIYGSIWQKFIFWSKEEGTSKQIDAIKSKAIKAVELQTIEKVQSETNLNNATAISHLIKSLENQDEGYLKLGNILVCKKNGKIYSKVLTVDELLIMESVKESHDRKIEYALNLV